MINNEYFLEIKKIILPALSETLYMVFFSCLFSIIIGICLGIILYVTEKDNILSNSFINKTLGIIVNIGRSIPFVIMMIAVFPLSKLIVGTTIGATAAIVPLTIATIPFVARMIESSLKEIDKGVIEASISMGATEFEIITKVIIPESISSIISTITTTIISVIGYSAMAGTIGGGGLGDVALRYGYQRFRSDILIISIIIILIIVQIVQNTGNFISNKLNKK